jgi:hypothetical protein
MIRVSAFLVSVLLLAMVARSEVAVAQEACPGKPNAHVTGRSQTTLADGTVKRTTKCACNQGYENRGGACVLVTVMKPREDSAKCRQLKQDIEQTKVAANRANLALDSYSFYDDMETKGWQAPWKAPPGYTLVSNQINELRKFFPGKEVSDIQFLIAPPESTYRAAVYRDQKGTLIVSFRGTARAGDWKANIPNEIGLWTAHYARAAALGRDLRTHADRSNVQLEVVGHSLGGGLAIAASAGGRVQATVFNPATVYDRALSEGVNLSAAKGLVTAYTTPREPLTLLQTLTPAPGQHIMLPDWPGSPPLVQPGFVDAAVERHSMRAVRQAVLARQQQLEKSYGEDCR